MRRFNFRENARKHDRRAGPDIPILFYFIFLKIFLTFYFLNFTPIHFPQNILFFVHEIYQKIGSKVKEDRTYNTTQHNPRMEKKNTNLKIYKMEYR